MNTPTVFVVDDDPSLRTAVSRLLASVGLRVETFASALDFLRAVDPGRPGCLILDIRMPGSSGLDLQRDLVDAARELPIIFISAHVNVAQAVRAMRAGALHVFTKPFDDQALLDAVHEALAQDERRRADAIELQQLRDRLSTLTSREREVMTFVVTGMPNKQIAFEMGTSEKTVKAHRGQVMHKMAAHSLADLVRMADRLSSTTITTRHSG